MWLDHPLFYRWINGVRRVKLTIRDAYGIEDDVWGPNDLYVVVTRNNSVLLCTEVAQDRARPYFSKNKVVFDYYPGDKITFTLMEEDLAENDRYMYESRVLRAGKSTVAQNGDEINYEVSDSNEPIGSSNQIVPQDLSYAELFGGLAAAAAVTYVALNHEQDNSQLFSCLVQSGINNSTSNPLAASIVAEAVDSSVRNRGLSISNIASQTAVGLVANELRSNGHSDIANAIEAGVFLNCLASD